MRFSLLPTDQKSYARILSTKHLSSIGQDARSQPSKTPQVPHRSVQGINLTPTPNAAHVSSYV